MAEKQYYFTLKGFFKRLKQEYYYYTKRPWSLSEVGAFWDTVKDYDEVNETLYTYFRRFTNSYDMTDKYIPSKINNMLDVQARSGKGTLFWLKQREISNAVCIDFSDYLQQLALDRLKAAGYNIDSRKVTEFPLPFPDRSFDFIITYETIEHVYNYQEFMNELKRVITDDGIIILSCPNIAWEWVHWLAVLININHSEGPHRFLWRKTLIKCFESCDLNILEENSTIILPFNNKISIAVNKFFERFLPQSIKSKLALRRTFILRKK